MLRRNISPALLLLLLATGCHTAARTCNGHVELCDRPYDQVAYPGTHNADSNIADGFLAPDQTYTLTRQLTDGIRVLHMEIDAYAGGPYLCHSACDLGATALADGLTEVAAFVGGHPRDVFTLLMESNDVTSDDVWHAVVTAGLDRYALAQPIASPWPTLAQMIDRDKHVVLLLADQTNTGGGSYPALLPRWTLTWETPWDNTTLGDFARCQRDRGTTSAPLYVVDTYLEDQLIPTATHAQLVNDNPFLIDRLLHCQDATGRLPTFVMVNYYEVGDVLEDVDALNGLALVPSGNVDAFPPGDGSDL